MFKSQQAQARLAILTVELRCEQDVVLARQRARQIASGLGFDLQQQTRIATAMSEVARNALSYAGGGKVEFVITGQAPQALLMRVSDSGPGIDQLSAIFDGCYESSTGMGLGLIGAKRLMDDLKIQSVCASSDNTKRGTIVELIKFLPKQTPHLTPKDVQQLVDHLLRDHPQDAYAELHQQNQELLHTLNMLRQRQDELAQLNQELEYTNRGVVALYAELNDRAESLQQASELKSRFLSHLSHEFRTPLNGILGLSNMLLRRLDGELSAEQEKQVTFIRRSATSLSDLVNDLLDLAKVESGKSEVHVAPFQVADLFSTLLGMLRPLLDQNESVRLVFDHTMSDPGSAEGSGLTLYTDEAKVSQILRNLISNALKFTEQGEVRVSATLGSNQTIVFTVADTGIGIAATDQTRIFEEFVQVNHSLQRRVKGTGLGLPLCRKLAALLGGSVDVNSTVGIGSRFVLTLPISYSDSTLDAVDARSKTDLSSDRGDDSKSKHIGSIADQSQRSPVPSSDESHSTKKILLIDDDKVSRYTLTSSLAHSYAVIEAKDGYEGLYRARTQQPDAIVLDLSMPELNGFEVLTGLKADPLTQSIPVVILSSNALTVAQTEHLTTHAIALLSKQADSAQMLLQLQEALVRAVSQLCHDRD